jgi:hypothetical protein
VINAKERHARKVRSERIENKLCPNPSTYNTSRSYCIPQQELVSVPYTVPGQNSPKNRIRTFF